MNYLVHLFLSDPAPECLLGTLMGDFVKGPIPDVYSPGVRWGIELHRKVDAFAHHSPAFRRSKSRIDESYGYFKGVMVDVFYDHFMARTWNLYSSVPLAEFAQQVYRLLERHFAILPQGLQQVAPRMIAHNWLVSYRDPETIGRVLERLSARLRRSNPLGQGISELKKNYPLLAEDFDGFLGPARAHVGLLRRPSP